MAEIVKIMVRDDRQSPIRRYKGGLYKEKRDLEFSSPVVKVVKVKKGS